MKILAIETSCDETAIALVEANGGLKNPKFKIIKNLVSSQIKIHRPFGGVVPTLAKREHIKNLPILFKNIKSANHKLKPDLIAATAGPGLEPCLWAGINFTKEIHREIKESGNKRIELTGANHIEGHLYSFLLRQKNKIKFPAAALIASGGHTILLLLEDLVHYKKLGETRDDAVGECFDKVARMLNLAYPGGPEIEKISKKGNILAINFPRPMLNQKNYDFSFSGLKTAVLYYLRDNKNVKIEDVAASFQKAAFDVLINKTLRVAESFSVSGKKVKTILVSGGVAANKSLRKEFQKTIKKDKKDFRLIIPEIKFCGDNAAMIAVAAYIGYLKKKERKLEADGGLSI